MSDRKLVLQAAFQEIERREGKLTPSGLVDYARPEDSPIHDQFIWDDFAAGERQRVAHARALIRRYEIIKVIPEAQTIRVMREVYVHDPREPPGSQGYLRTDVARENPELSRSIVKQDLLQVLHLLGRVQRNAGKLNISLLPGIREIVKRVEVLKAKLD